MRLILILLTLIVIACAATFGALNSARIAIDFYFFQIEIPTGVALLATLLIGWMLGGLVAWLGHARRRRRDSRADRTASAGQPSPRPRDGAVA